MTSAAGFRSVWPDLAKFYDFGEILKVFGNFLVFILYLAKFEPTLCNFQAIKQIFTFGNSPNIKNNIAIWLHWQFGITMDIYKLDFLLTIVGKPAACTEPWRYILGQIKIHWPCIEYQIVFYGSWRHNYYCHQSQPGRLGQWVVYLFRCLWVELLAIGN